MKTKFWSVAVALLALVLCGTAVMSSAQQNDATGAQAWSGHRHGHMGFMAKQLNLTDAQKAQIKTIMQSQRTTDAESRSHVDGHFRRSIRSG
jgi:Spy/CpxP family protein refolding chaperone